MKRLLFRILRRPAKVASFPRWAVVLVAGSLAGTAVLSAAQSPAPPAVAETAATAVGRAPRIEFATPNYDFGRVGAGQVVKHDFVFTNTGNATLVLTEVRPGCGCTTSGTWDSEVEPGRTGRIPIQFNSGGFSGRTSKSISVRCNDPQRPSLFLQISADVWTPVTLQPASVYFNLTGESPTNQVRTVRLVSNLDGPLTLEEPETESAAFRTHLKTVQPGREYELEVTTVLPLPTSYVHAPITIKTSSPEVPVLTVPATAMVQPVVTVMPATLTLPANWVPGGVAPAVTLRNTGSQPLVLTDPTLNVEGATVQVNELQPGRLFRLMLQIPAGAALRPGERWEVKVKTSHPSYPEITVPVVQAPRPATTTTLRPPLRPVTPPPPPPGAPLGPTYR
ncbi:MAG: DUF1573 domain-containing protein [Verrucomicrobiae bacterium]|nr:DUF1573 domain-containing protein [Verrucomicrobiae bacterium]